MEEDQSWQNRRQNPNAITCCILFATADWDEPYWTNKQHCAKTLADLGIKVLYVESVGLRSPKLNSAKDIKRIARRIMKVAYCCLIGPSQRSAGLYVVSPFTLPGSGPSSIRSKVNTWLLDLLVKTSATRLGFEDALIWAYHPFIGNCLRMPQVSKALYHCVDDLSSVPGIDAIAFKLAEARLVKLVDACFVTAPHLLNKCSSFNTNTYYLPNVVDIDHFSLAGRKKHECPMTLTAIPEPRIVYHGVLSDFKIDFALLIECARLRPEWSFVVIGEEREGQRDQLVDQLRRTKNVFLLGYKSYSEIPLYLNHMNLGILPSLINQYTTSMFPMKFYEYIASGLPVVSTPLDFTKHVEGGLVVGSNTTEFVNAIKIQLERGRLSLKESEEIVGDNTWKARTLKMLRSVEDSA